MALLLANVPVQALGQRVEPVGYLVLGADRRHGVNRSRHSQTVFEIGNETRCEGLSTLEKKNPLRLFGKSDGIARGEIRGQGRGNDGG